MPKLDTATTKRINEILREAKDIEIYSISAFAGGSEITKCLIDIKTVLIKNKGKDVTVVVGIR